MSRIFVSKKYSKSFATLMCFYGTLMCLYHIGHCHYDETTAKPKMEGRIVRGSPVDIERYPWSVLLFNSGAVCAGTILNAYSVLSAAHCFGHNNKTSDITIHVGSKFLYDYNSVIHTVRHVVSHEDYNKEIPFASDIALVFLEVAIVYSSKAQKALVVTHDKWMNQDETGFIVTGWGMIKAKGPLSEHGLLMATMKYIPSPLCEQMHQVNLTSDMFCLYGDARKDTCNGDSGGGVIWNGYLVGVVSHGDGCASKDKPSIYTNVWVFRDWMDQKIKQYGNATSDKPMVLSDNLRDKNIGTSARCKVLVNGIEDSDTLPKEAMNKARVLQNVTNSYENESGSSEEEEIDGLIGNKRDKSRNAADDTADRLVERNRYVKLQL